METSPLPLFLCLVRRLCFAVWWILSPSVFKYHREKKKKKKEEDILVETESATRFSLARLPFSEPSRFCAITIEINYAPGGVISV